MTTNRHGLTSEDVAHLKGGDHAELIFEYTDGANCMVSGPLFPLDSGLVILAGHLVRYSDGSPGDQLLAVVSPKPPTPGPLPVVDLPEGVALARDPAGRLWVRLPVYLAANWISLTRHYTSTATDCEAAGWERVAVAPAPPVPDDVIDAAARVIDAQIGGDGDPCEGSYADARALAKAGLLVGTKPEAGPLPEGHVVVDVTDLPVWSDLPSLPDVVVMWKRVREAVAD